MDDGKIRTITESDIVEKFAAVAFGEEAKDSDRMRALEWLAGYLDRKSTENSVMAKLDEVLAELKK